MLGMRWLQNPRASNAKYENGIIFPSMALTTNAATDYDENAIHHGRFSNHVDGMLDGSSMANRLNSAATKQLQTQTSHKGQAGSKASFGFQDIAYGESEQATDKNEKSH